MSETQHESGHVPEPDRVDDVDAAGRGETEPVLDRSAGASDPGSVGGDNGGA